VGEIETKLSGVDASLETRDWLGAMTPTWDDAIPLPSEPYTTRICLRCLTKSAKQRLVSLKEDLMQVNQFKGTILAVLAIQGLRKLTTKMGDSEPQCWDMELLSDGLVSVSLCLFVCCVFCWFFSFCYKIDRSKQRIFLAVAYICVRPRRRGCVVPPRRSVEEPSAVERTRGENSKRMGQCQEGGTKVARLDAPFPTR